MQGNIDFSGTLSGSIAGGGSGGSEVTITPTLQSGTKIADYSIDETTGSLYAPAPESLPSTIVTKALRKYNDDTQTKIMTVTTLDTENDQEVSQDIYAPSPVQCWYIPEATGQDVLIGKFTYGEVTQNVYIPNFQSPLTAGTGIDITNNVISCTASGSSWDFSTSEVDTGQKWKDGKNIFSRVIQINNFSMTQTYGAFYYGDFTISDYISNADIVFGDIEHSYIISNGDLRGIVGISIEKPVMLVLSPTTRSNVTAIISLKYTKTI